MTVSFEDLPLSERLAMSGEADRRSYGMVADPSLIQTGAMLIGGLSGAYARPTPIPTLLPGASAYDALYAAEHTARMRQETQGAMDAVLGRMLMNTAGRTAQRMSGGRLSGEALYSVGRGTVAPAMIGSLAGMFPFVTSLAGGSPLDLAMPLFGARASLDTAAGGFSDPLSVSTLFDNQGRPIDASRDTRRYHGVGALIRGALTRTYGENGGILPDHRFNSGLSNRDMGSLLTAMIREDATYTPTTQDGRPAAGTFRMRGGTSSTDQKLDEAAKYARALAKTMEVLGTTDFSAAMDELDRAAGGRMFKTDPRKLEQLATKVAATARSYGADSAALFAGLSQMTKATAEITGGVNRVSGAITAPSIGMYAGGVVASEAARLASITGRPVQQHLGEVGDQFLRVLGSPGGAMARVIGGLTAQGQLSGDQFEQYMTELGSARNDPARMRSLASEIGTKTIGRDLWSIMADDKSMAQMAQAMEARPDIGARVVDTTIKASSNEAVIRGRRAITRRLETIVRGATGSSALPGNDDQVRLAAMRARMTAALAEAAGNPAAEAAARADLARFDAVTAGKTKYADAMVAIGADARLSVDAGGLRDAADASSAINAATVASANGKITGQAQKNVAALIASVDMLDMGSARRDGVGATLASVRAVGTVARAWADLRGEGQGRDEQRVAAVTAVLAASGAFVRRQLETTKAGRAALDELERVRAGDETEAQYNARRGKAAMSIGDTVIRTYASGEMRDLLVKPDKTPEERARQKELAEYYLLTADTAIAEIKRMNPGSSDELLEHPMTSAERAAQRGRQADMAAADKKAADRAAAFKYTQAQRMVGFLSGETYTTSDGKSHAFTLSDALGIRDMSPETRVLRTELGALTPEKLKGMSQERAYELYSQFKDPEAASAFMDAYNAGKAKDGELAESAPIDKDGKPRAATDAELRKLSKARANEYVAGLDDDALGTGFFQFNSSRRDELSDKLANEEYDKMVAAPTRMTAAEARRSIRELTERTDKKEDARAAKPPGEMTITGAIRLITATGSVNAILEPGTTLTGKGDI